jgi:photosystem II stability/assembly factor-like uncharacterized protein
LAGGLVVALFCVGVVLAVVTSRRVRGSIPGSDSILSLAAIRAGFLVGTSRGLAASQDGATWAAARIQRQQVAVASDGTSAYVLAEGDVRVTSDLSTYTVQVTGVTGTAVAGGSGGSVYVAHAPWIALFGADGKLRALPSSPPVKEGVVALTAAPGNPSELLAGGPISGLWQSQDAGATWHRLVGTPSQAVLIDPANPQRILLGSPGGLLESVDGGTQWRFTQLRKDVHGLAAAGGVFFAVTSERILYESSDGVGRWKPLTGQ